MHDAEAESGPVPVLREAWTAVLRHDYEPVFRTVLNVLEALAAADALGGVKSDRAASPVQHCVEGIEQ